MKNFDIHSVKEIFEEVEKTSSVKRIKAIAIKYNLPAHYPSDKYPKLTIQISPDEVADFNLERVLENIDNQLTGPFAKLLYALAWKNGDLQKIKHIVSGIHAKPEDELTNDALVFKQFGKHLANRETEPIVDQHILRAFAIFKAENEEVIKALRKQSIFKDWSLVNEYKNWLYGLNGALKQEAGWLKAVDELLFAVGKSAKSK